MRYVGIETLYLELGDLQNIELYLKETAGATFLGALTVEAISSGITSDNTIPARYKKLEASDIAKSSYPDLFARIEDAFRTRNI